LILLASINTFTLYCARYLLHTVCQVTRDHKHLICIGANTDTVYLFAIDELMDDSASAQMKPKPGDYRPRMVHTQRECDA